ncbi:helicase HerA domain-containing protein, partial [Hydrogenimonas sp.]
MDKIFEKLGIFYLGRDLDPETMEPTDTPTLVKSKNFTTHAAIIGMTGSGKTGLGIDLLEEAAIDNIPIIAIDPKGDMGNLCLAFPDLEPDDFLPWVEEEALEKGLDPKALAAKTAEMWRKGIESFDQAPERIRRFKEHEATIYTPGSTAGVPVSVLGSLNAPDPETLEDADAFAQSVNTTVASLLSLLGIEADPLESREFILLAQIV